MANTIIAQPAPVGDHGNSPSRRIRGQRRQYTCGYCEKVFKRSEHRIRHERTHTNEKPFSCRYCKRSYSRKDLVTRHERTLHAQGQAEPSALPALVNPGEGDGSSDGSLSEAGEGEIARRSGDADAAAIAADDPPSSESEASPASSVITCGAAAGEPPSLPAPVVSSEDGIGDSSAMDETRLQPPPQEPPLAQSTVSTGPPPSLANLPDPPSTHSASQPTDVYLALQDGFNMYEASSQMHMDVDDDREQRIHHDGYRQVPEPQHHPQLQRRPHQAHDFHPFPQYDRGAPVNAMNQDLDPEFLPTFEPDMSYFAFSPLPAGLFEVGQNIPILDIPEYPSLHNPTATRFDAALSPAPAPPAYSPSQLSPVNDHAGSSGSETVVAREPPSNLPLLVKDKPPQIPNFVADDTLHASICKDLAERLGRPDVSQEIPSSKFCQGFLASFLECYYRHQPFIHLPTLSTTDTPSPLILAMCCIGALYRLDRRRAQRLYTIATQSIATDVQRYTKSSEEWPLWVAQTKLLLSAYGALSGNKDLATSVMDENGFYTLVYGKMRLALAAENPDLNKMTWDSWVRRESWKRLLGGIYVASTVHVVIWDTNPGFNTSQDLELEVLHDESLWNAKTATEWRELRANLPQQDYRTLKDGLASIMSEGKPDSPGISACRLSSFTALLLMHAVIVHMWQLVQVAQALSPTPLSLGRDPVSSLLMSTAVRSLARCHELLDNAQNENAGDPGHEEGTSQIFNCQATLRMAYIRLFSVANGFNRLSLITLDPAAIESFVSTFAITKLERGPQLLNAVVKAFEGLKIPVRMGHMLVRKTAALRWSPAHAISGWDCALFVCKWVHSVEMDRLNDIEPSMAECELLASITDVLEEADYDPGKSRSLAAGVARTWSWLLQDVWVWSITPRMGAVLEQIATAFERVNDANRRPGA